MRVYLGYDHRGEKLAYKLIEELVNLGLDVNLPYDNNSENDDYPDISVAVCAKVKKDKKSFGVLICGTGIGMCMAANREEGIRAVLAENEEKAYFARRHEDSDVLVLSAGYEDDKYKVKEHKNVFEIIKVFIETEFEEGRHIKRIKKLDLINNK